jgi:hypothetical protein
MAAARFSDPVAGKLRWFGWFDRGGRDLQRMHKPAILTWKIHEELAGADQAVEIL